MSFARAGDSRTSKRVVDRPNAEQLRRARPGRRRARSSASPSRDVNMIGGRLGVALQRTAAHHTLDQALWVAIRNRTRAISFGPYRDFIDRVLCGRGSRRSPASRSFDRRLQDLGREPARRGRVPAAQDGDRGVPAASSAASVHRAGRYEHHRLFNRDDESERLGEFVTIDFVADEAARVPRHSRRSCPTSRGSSKPSFPEYRAAACAAIACSAASINEPCLIELIWSYWHEEGMLVQSMNAINRRFQNVRAPGRPRSAGAFRARSAAARRQPAVGPDPGRAEPALGQAARLRVLAPLRAVALRPRGRIDAAGRQPLEVPGGVPQPAAPDVDLLQGRQRHDGHRRRFPAAERAEGSAPDPRAGRAQPVRRPAVDRARRDDDAAVHPGAAGDSRVPPEPAHGAVQGSRGCRRSTR